VLQPGQRIVFPPLPGAVPAAEESSS
jgi:hypothetical protein